MPSLPSAPGPVLVAVTRSGRTESWHRGAIAVWHGGDLLFALGDAGAEVVCRSTTKPLQALPFFDRGLPERLGLGAPELAVMCASHGGAEPHVAAVRRFLAAGGLDESLLGCGPHAPLDADARRALLRQDRPPLRVHNNCSGKHAGFLHLANVCGDDLTGYLDPQCSSQQQVHAAVAAMAGVAGPLPVGVDGCGAPTFSLPLRALARAFASLADPDGLPLPRAAACRAIVAAAGREPLLFAGEHRLCTALLRALPGRILPKNGAEGVYALALPPDPARRACPAGVGIAVKVDDGGERGYQPVLLDLLLRLGALDPPLPPALAAFHVQPVVNTRGERVGEARCAVDWAQAGLP
jgi:L-asparaginase II